MKLILRMFKIFSKSTKNIRQEMEVKQELNLAGNEDPVNTNLLL